MTEIIKKGFGAYSPWFDVEKDGLPVRKGVYEGSAAGIPGEGGTLQHGYYRWNGRAWVAWGTHPGELGILLFKPQYWRGVIPNADYPFDQVEPNDSVQEASAEPAIFTGTLHRSGAPDKVTVSHFQRSDKTLALAFVRAMGKREPEEYECTLARLGGEYEGSAKATVRGFVLDKVIRIRVSLNAETHAGLEVFMTLQGTQPLVFEGVLTVQGAAGAGAA